MLVNFPAPSSITGFILSVSPINIPMSKPMKEWSRNFFIAPSLQKVLLLPLLGKVTGNPGWSLQGGSEASCWPPEGTTICRDTLRKVGEEGSKSAWLRLSLSTDEVAQIQFQEKYSFSTIKPLLYCLYTRRGFLQGAFKSLIVVKKGAMSELNDNSFLF